MYYALILDSNGNGIGLATYVEEPATYPANQVACTQAQAAQPALWHLVNGALVQSLSATQAAQIALIKGGFATATATAPITINGVSYTIDLASIKQAVDLAALVAANNAVNHPVPWVASTPVAQYATQQLADGTFLFCTVGGTTGTTAPTAPTAFGTSVTDGTVTWELYGRCFDTMNGTYAWFTPQEILSVFQQVELWVHACKQQRYSLIAEVNAQTAVPATYVTWTNP